MTAPDLRIGIAGDTATAHGVAFQVQATPGMELTWQTEDDPTSLLKEDTIDVFVEASSATEVSAQNTLAALEHNAHCILTNPAADLALGPLCYLEAYQRGLIVTSNAGSRHGVLATLIQEADIMGFDIVQAGALTTNPEDPTLKIELTLLANAMGYLPPDGGLTNPPVTQLKDALGLFDFDSYGDTPRIESLTTAEESGGVYLIVKPKPALPAKQQEYLKSCHLGDGPYYILHRSYHLGHLETPKAILGAAAGQSILSHFQSTCDLYAFSNDDLSAGSTISQSSFSTQIAPLNDELIPATLLETPAIVRTDLKKGDPLTIDTLELPDTPLTHLWIKQRKLLENSYEE